MTAALWDGWHVLPSAPVLRGDPQTEAQAQATPARAELPRDVIEQVLSHVPAPRDYFAASQMSQVWRCAAKAPSLTAARLQLQAFTPAEIASMDSAQRWATLRRDASVQVSIQHGRCRTQHLAKHTAPVGCLAISPRGKHVVIGDKTDETLLRIHSRDAPMPPTDRWICTPAFRLQHPRINATGSHLLLDVRPVRHVDGPRHVSLYRLDHLDDAASFAGALATFDAAGKQVAVAGRGGGLHVYRIDTPALQRTFSGFGLRSHGVVFSPDGNKLAVACDAHVTQVWDLTEPRAAPQNLQLPWVDWTHGFAHAVFNAAGSHLITSTHGALGHRAAVWDLDAPQHPVLPASADTRVSAAAFSADGRQAITAVEAGNVRLWRLDRLGTPLSTAHTALKDVRGVALSPDSKTGLILKIGERAPWLVDFHDLARPIARAMPKEQDDSCRHTLLNPRHTLLLTDLRKTDVFGQGYAVTSVCNTSDTAASVNLTSLSHGNISCVAFDATGSCLLAGYESGDTWLVDFDLSKPLAEGWTPVLAKNMPPTPSVRLIDRTKMAIVPALLWPLTSMVYGKMFLWHICARMSFLPPLGQTSPRGCLTSMAASAGISLLQVPWGAAGFFFPRTSHAIHQELLQRIANLSQRAP